MHTMLTTVNVVQIIISDSALIVFITFKVFWNFSKLLLVLHILAFPNFYSGDTNHATYGKHNFKKSFPTLRTLCITDLHRFETF